MKKIILVLIILFAFLLNTYAEDQTLQNNDTENQESTTNNEIQKEEIKENSNTNQDNKAKENKKNKSTSGTINLAENAKSAIMIEASTGKIIYEKNSNEKLPMASMTKMMTLLLIIENIESGNLKWDEKVTASEYASSMGGSQIFLEPGEEMTVEDLVKGICIGSGNDVVVSKKQSLL